MGCYWNRTGVNEALMKQVSDVIQNKMKTVGIMGNTKEDDAMRAMLWLQRVYYDAYNNGWCKWKIDEPIYKNFQMYTAKYLRRNKIIYKGFEKLYKDEQLLEDVTNQALMCVARDLRLIK